MAEKLAIDGGPKSVTECLTPWPQMSEEAIKAVEEVLRSGKVNYWTGPKGQQFELEFAKWQGSNFGISVNSGTSALHVAMAAAGIGPRRRGYRAELHVHRDQLFRRPGRGRSPASPTSTSTTTASASSRSRN